MSTTKITIYRRLHLECNDTENEQNKKKNKEAEKIEGVRKSQKKKFNKKVPDEN